MTTHRASFLCAAVVLSVSSMSVALGDDDHQWLQIEQLNAGLGHQSGDLNRTTPRQTVLALRRLAERQSLTEAAHLLNLNRLSAGEQASRGPALAKQLDEIISRTMIID